MFRDFNSIQSPSLTKPEPYTCTLATRPSMVSLKTRTNIAPIAPMPDRMPQGESPNTRQTASTPEMM